MGNAADTLIQQYGIYGILLIVLLGVGYLIWGDRKNNWGSKIDRISTKMDGVDEKIDRVKNDMKNRIDGIEDRIQNLHQESKNTDRNEAKNQSVSLMNNGSGGKLSKLLRLYCKEVDCDHIFMGSFHNGTVDLRGLHYCKFDILIDEYKDPLHLHPNDVDFGPLYKDENIIAYGDLPCAMTHVDTAVFKIDENTDLFELSDTLHRRCKGRDIKVLGLACIYDDENSPVGFIGCVKYDDNNINELKLHECARQIENIYKVQ